MAKEKSLGQILGEKVLASLSPEERAKVVTITLPPPKPEVYEFIQRLDRFEKASRKVNIRVGGDGCDYCKRARELQQMFYPSNYS